MRFVQAGLPQAWDKSCEEADTERHQAPWLPAHQPLAICAVTLALITPTGGGRKWHSECPEGFTHKAGKLV